MTDESMSQPDATCGNQLNSCIHKLVQSDSDSDDSTGDDAVLKAKRQLAFRHPPTPAPSRPNHTGVSLGFSKVQLGDSGDDAADDKVPHLLGSALVHLVLSVQGVLISIC